MPLEYEYQFYEYNKLNVIKNIKKLGFKKKGKFIFRVMIFNHPLNKPNTIVRIRDEGHRITLTFKETTSKSKFENEEEIIIDNFENGIKILLSIGCKEKYYYEKIREIWYLDNNEIIFDTNPGEPERMEIESSTKKELDSLVKELKLTDFIKNIDYDPTKELFGFVIENITNLTFETVKKLLGPLVTANKVEFNKLVDKQIEIYKNMLKKTLKK